MADSTAAPVAAPAVKPPLDRVGGCIVCLCEAYEHELVADGFRTCVCHHTQWAHADAEGNVT